MKQQKNILGGAALVIFLTILSAFFAPDAENAKNADTGATASSPVITNTVTTANLNEASDMLTEPGDFVTGDSMEVHFIDVGQGDATLVKCGEHALLIDAGDNTKGTAVQLYLEKQQVFDLDAVIWTHPDADHIGGADVITTKFDIGTVYMPDRETDTKTYRELLDALAYRGYQPTVPALGDSFLLGEATVTFLGPLQAYEDDNNNSIVCKITFGNTCFLFAGDAEEEAEQDLVAYAEGKKSEPNDSLKVQNAKEASAVTLQADVYKVSHHGSKTSSTEAFLKAVKPTYAVISCAEGNDYWHPHGGTLNRLRKAGVKLYRTDEQGSIIATSDGNEITWNCAPSETWKAGERRSEQ